MKKFLNVLGGILPRAQKNNVISDLYYQSYIQSPGKAVWSKRDYRKFADEAYVKNVIAHQCVKKIATAASNVKIKVRKNGEEVANKNHPLVSLLAAPNPCASLASLFEEMYSYKLISGNAYVLAIGPENGYPLEMHVLRPDRVSIIAGRDGMPAAYRYKISANESKDYGRHQILHLKYFHPLDDWYGLSPVEAAAYSIDQHNQAGEWNQALLQNGARPSGALIVKNSNGDSGGHLSEDQYHRIKAQVDNEFAGSANAGRPLLLEGGLDWKEMSINPKDMDFINMKNSAARDIALAFGVPPQLLGIPGDNTYSNLAEARLAFWEQTILPLVEEAIDALNGWLVPMFDSDVKLQPDLENISALAPRREAMWERVKGADFLSDDEKRELVGI